MQTSSSVADTVRSNVDFSLCFKSGFRTISSFTIPTFIDPTSLSNGISEILSAIEAPIAAGTSGSTSGSTASTSALIDVSFL